VTNRPALSDSFADCIGRLPRRPLLLMYYLLR
jgi:hypothetical protein